MNKLPKFRNGKRGVALAIRVIPRAQKNEISEIMEDGSIKIRLTAVPQNNQANEALIRFLANILNIKVTNIEIVAGKTSHNKLVTVEGLDNQEVNRVLDQWIKQ